MRRKTIDPVAPAYGGNLVDPDCDRYMKKCLKKYPFLYKMIDYIVDYKIAALRAEMCQMWSYRQPIYPGMNYPGMTYPGMMGPGMMGPGVMGPGMMGPGMMESGMMGPGSMSTPGMSPIPGYPQM